MHRRTFLTGLLGAVGAAAGVAIATRAEAASPAGAGALDAAAKQEPSLADRLPENAEIQKVHYHRRRHYYRRRAPRRWRPVRRRRQVCRVTRNRWGNVRRVCTWR